MGILNNIADAVKNATQKVEDKADEAKEKTASALEAAKKAAVDQQEIGRAHV